MKPKTEATPAHDPMVSNPFFCAAMDATPRCSVRAAPKKREARSADWIAGLEPAVWEGRVHLAFAGSKVSPSVRLDPQALWLALDLLVDNAVRHGVADQPIQLVLQLDGSGTSFVLEIISVGAAAPVGPDALQGWLRPFVRAELDRDAHRVEGAGLGLSLVRQLVESWGGTVALSQRQCSPDQQTETCVTVTVPLQEPLGGSEAAPGDEQTDPV